jgi:serine/threonine protein kinase
MEGLSKYRILHELGSQKNRKFGKVYLVEHTESGIKAVLKHLTKDSVKETIIERLRSEASFDFEMKGLPKTLFFHEDETELILLKEYFEGVPLDIFWKEIRNKDRLTTLKSIFNQLAPLFYHLKEQSIAHCDLKPSNIIVRQNENELFVALIDFGMAIRYPAKEQRSILFPLGYAAPELLLNELELIDDRTDFYSLGIIIWRLYENKLPFMHPNPSIYTNLQINHPLPEPDHMSKGMFNLVKKLSAKHAFNLPPNQLNSEERKMHLKAAMNQRPSNFSEILAELNEVKDRKWLFF